MEKLGMRCEGTIDVWGVAAVSDAIDARAFRRRSA